MANIPSQFLNKTLYSGSKGLENAVKAFQKSKGADLTTDEIIAFTQYYSSDNTGGTPPKKESLLQEFTKGIGNFVQASAQTQISQGPGGGQQYITQEFFGDIAEEGIKLDSLWKVVKKAVSEVGEQLQAQTNLQNEINSKTTLTGDLSKKLRDDIEQASISSAEFGITMAELGDLYVGMVQNSGKFSLINQETLEKAAPTVRAFGDTMANFANTLTEFEKVGIGTNKTIDLIGVAGTKSMSLGLSGKKVVTDITSNIGKLNEYGFSKGVEGLTRMVQKSLEFKMNLESVFTIADKVMNPEGALDLVANLQVLGGAIGDLGDPLKLMYDATNNVEGIQDALIGAAGSLATYNQEQGRFEITGLNLRRAKEMAAQLGISYQELAKGAISAAERSSAASAMLRSGVQVSEKDREFLTNLSSMEGGQMVIKIPKSIADELGVPTKLALEKLDQKTANALLENSKRFEDMSVEEVAQSQLTATEKMMRDIEVIAAYYKVRGVQLLGKAADKLGVKDLFEKDLAKFLSGAKKDITGTGTNDMKTSMDEVADAAITIATTTTAQDNPGHHKIVEAKEPYPSAVNKHLEIGELGTKKGTEPMKIKVEENIESTQDVNKNISETARLQVDATNIQTDKLNEIKSSSDVVSTKIDESKNVSQKTENIDSNKVLSTIANEKNNKEINTVNKDEYVTNTLNQKLNLKEEEDTVNRSKEIFDKLFAIKEENLTKNDITTKSNVFMENTSDILKTELSKVKNEKTTSDTFNQLFTRKEESIGKNENIDTLSKNVNENISQSKNVLESLTNTNTINDVYNQLFVKKEGKTTQEENTTTDINKVNIDKNVTENVDKNIVSKFSKPFELNTNPITVSDIPTIGRTEPLNVENNTNINTTQEVAKTNTELANKQSSPQKMVVEHTIGVNVKSQTVVDSVARAILTNPESMYDNVPDYLKNPKIEAYG